MLLQESSNNTEHNRYNNTCQDHGSDGKVKTKILFFNTNITRQMTDPMEFVVEEIYDQPYDDYSAANEYQILAGV